MIHICLFWEYFRRSRDSMEVFRTAEMGLKQKRKSVSTLPRGEVGQRPYQDTISNVISKARQ